MKNPGDIIGTDGKVRILEEQCSTCIFRPGDLMYLGPGRLKRIIDANLRASALLTCHDTLPYGGSVDDPAACRGFWDSYGMKTMAGRLAARMIGITYVSLEENDGREEHEEAGQACPDDQPEEDQGGTAAGLRLRRPARPGGEARPGGSNNRLDVR